ncbi:archaellin/type IV pilin N-terminal domain-containing protein [Halomicroarcula sp. GCM10025709]|uniref:archaellin/type IV pilin N-terminal domain-containing protein n=1 Tax=Haloarcula TaxID=2237 RepID=UPI0024C3E3CA|nr:archaellin/type IV pilin N-terminal domain-containing protein [Halomicroarcula sp. YJ-61-S]
MSRSRQSTHKGRDRGQVGIGTLIVFIAMVLVAAIAAGVLVNTAGFLQSSAEETGQQSSDQVTNRLNVVSTVGTKISYNVRPSVSEIEITVRKVPGAGNIDLGETTIQMVHTSGSYDFLHGERGGLTDAPNNTHFAVDKVQDDDDSISDSYVLNDPEDRATIVVDVDDARAGQKNNGNAWGFEEGETATFRLNTQSGGTTELRVVVPETLSDTSVVSV